MAEPQTELAVGTYMKVIVGEPTTYDVAGFESIMAAAGEVVDVVNIGAGGGTAAVQSYVPLKTGVTVKRSGAIDYQDRTVQMGRHVETNAVHQALKSGFDGVNKGLVHSVGIYYVDGSVDFFVATISSFAEEQLEANTFKFVNVTLSPTDKTVTKVGTGVFTLAYAAGANGAVYGDLEQRVEDGEDGTAVFAAPLNPLTHEFDQWSDASTDNPRTDLNVTANITVTAQFVTV